MEPPKRKAHKNAVITNLLRANPAKVIPVKVPKTRSIYTQTEAIKANGSEDAFRPKAKLAQQEKGPAVKEDSPAGDAEKRLTKNKACQTQKASLKRAKPDTSIDPQKATMLKRRKMAIDVDRARLKKLLDEINSDPPPSWHKASIMWLDVDVLERRIEEFEQEEAAKKTGTA
ncbi:uncharacterized protein [Drosophila virilis]|uniref:Uncharacterized protein n=1 Tax=Drosophila virilis TaxID=7244 RepID=B4LRT6_DROVI|nr:uncharacterized protein LOC6627957 [Drosophila virilis]EDW64688.1 uncharacterized protein Dvir_GJ21091 [Drosophila virilis]